MTLIYSKNIRATLLADTFSEVDHNEFKEKTYESPINQIIVSVNKLGLYLSNDLSEKKVGEAFSKYFTKYENLCKIKKNHNLRLVGKKQPGST